jgi:hypothetical protein
MIVMPGANTGFDCGVLFGRFPHRLGHLFTPDKKNGCPRLEYPWALDNGVFGAWATGREWNPRPFYDFLEKYGFLKPRWVAVPDWVADRDETLRRWDVHAPRLIGYGIPLAMVVQDGMTPADVPEEATIVFVGGSTEWKWRHLCAWTDAGFRVHVGRVNTYRLLWLAHQAGAESCDGTGWFRGDRQQMAGLTNYLIESNAGERRQKSLWMPHTARNAGVMNSTDRSPIIGDAVAPTAAMS